MIDYEKLWKLLEVKGLKKDDLKKELTISTTTLEKLNNNEKVSADVLENICRYLNCDIRDIMEEIQDSSLVEIKNCLSKLQVFNGVEKSTIEKAAHFSDVIKLKKNQRLYSDKQELFYVYFVKKGKVTISKYSEHGDNKVIFILGENDLINQPIMRKNTSAVECWGFENSEILRIGFSDFDKLMKEDYTLARNCMIYMENRIRRLYRQLKNSVSINIEKKLAAKLFKLGSTYGQGSNRDIMASYIVMDGRSKQAPSFSVDSHLKLNDEFTKLNIDITITKISKMLGCQRETVSRAMRELVDKGMVKTSGREIWLNLKRLQEFFKS